MAFLRYQVTAVQISTSEVVFSSYLPTWSIGEILLKADKKYGLDVIFSIVPVHLNCLPDVKNEINKL